MSPELSALVSVIAVALLREAIRLLEKNARRRGALRTRDQDRSVTDRTLPADDAP